MNDILALMLLRHNGVPTRLLDWTRSPHVAAYFAAADNDCEDGEIWCFEHSEYRKRGKEQWPIFPETTLDGSGEEEKLDMSFPTAFRVEEPSDWFVCYFYEHGFPRQKAQDGAYSFTSRLNRDHSEAIANLLKDDSFYHRYIIAPELKPVLRKALREKHGIWRGSLFPDVAGAAETALKVVFESGTDQDVSKEI